MSNERTMSFSTRRDVVNYFDNEPTSEVREELAAKLIDAAHESGLYYGDNWFDVWNQMAGTEAKLIALMTECETVNV